MPLLTVAFLGYFGFHAFNGFYGIRSHERLEREAVALAGQLDALKGERAALERRVTGLRPDKLDADMIDTEARVALNRLRPDEILIDLGAMQQNRQ